MEIVANHHNDDGYFYELCYGYYHGIKGEPKQNPYPEASEEAKAYNVGYADGQQDLLKLNKGERQWKA